MSVLAYGLLGFASGILSGILILETFPWGRGPRPFQ